MSNALFILDILQHEAKHWENQYMQAYYQDDYEDQISALDNWINALNCINVHHKLNGLS